VRKVVLSILINLVFLIQLCLVDNYTKINPIQFRYKNNFFLYTLIELKTNNIKDLEDG